MTKKLMNRIINELAVNYKVTLEYNKRDDELRITSMPVEKIKNGFNEINL